MKKIAYFILLIIIFPVMVNARECYQSEIEQYRNELGKISYEIEYVPKGTQYGIDIDMRTVDTDNFLKVTAPLLNSNYELEFQSSDKKTYLVSSNIYSFITGGVYEVNVYNNVCNQPIATLEVMLPHYKQYENNKNLWFDGTYENNVVESNSKVKNKYNIKLIIALIFAIISLIVIIVVKRNRRTK